MNPADAALYDDVSRIGAALWKASPLEGNFQDPKMMSVILFKRLWSHHRGYAALLKERLFLEGDIILRSGVEAAICLAANFHLKEEFIKLMFGDAVHTLSRQIIQHRDEGDVEMVIVAEATLRELREKLPADVKALPLAWKGLAKAGQVPQLYGWYKMISSTSSHVTGQSILRGIEDDETASMKADLHNHAKRMHPLMMIGAMLQRSFLHAFMIERNDLAQDALVLVKRLDARLADAGY